MRNIVPPEGDITRAYYALVGEQPGEIERKMGRPFVGPSGRVENECLTSVQIARQDCYITNVIKDLDHPIEYYINITRSGVIVSNEGREYINSLHEELRLLPKDSIIIAIGNIALYALLDIVGITKWRGSVLEYRGRKLVPHIHPATVIPPKNVYTNRLLIQFDLKKAKDLHDGVYRFKERSYIINPSVTQCLEFLARCTK